MQDKNADKYSITSMTDRCTFLTPSNKTFALSKMPAFEYGVSEESFFQKNTAMYVCGIVRCLTA